MEIENVVWCTGFARDNHWIRLPVFGPGAGPVHRRGVVDTEPGLYFIGLPYQHSLASSLIGGVGPDAQYIAQQVTTRRSRPRPPVADALSA